MNALKQFDLGEFLVSPEFWRFKQRLRVGAEVLVSFAALYVAATNVVTFVNLLRKGE